MSSEQAIARQYLVHGRVQGVGFRFFVERCAQQLDLGGYVRNRADGAVEVYAVGPKSKLEVLSERLWSGPRFAHVDRVEELEVDPLPLAGFQIRY